MKVYVGVEARAIELYNSNEQWFTLLTASLIEPESLDDVLQV